MNNATETIKLVQLLDAFCEAFNRHDPDAIVSMITDDCEFRPALGDKQFGASIKGKSALKKRLSIPLQCFQMPNGFPGTRMRLLGNGAFQSGLLLRPVKRMVLFLRWMALIYFSLKMARSA